jgi:O-acetyl-ADP-ribose deacetylase (regulator of RNase III)
MEEPVATRISLFRGDITTLAIDAIVNAANRTLLGGGGVDGAIHRAAGLQLLEECKTLGGCDISEAKLTKGYNLPAKFIIHTVGPLWTGGNRNEDGVLAQCYLSSLTIATEQKFDTIAFPAISTGVYRFPPMRAARVACNAVRSYLEINELPKKVIFTAIDDITFNFYSGILKTL